MAVEQRRGAASRAQGSVCMGVRRGVPREVCHWVHWRSVRRGCAAGSAAPEPPVRVKVVGRMPVVPHRAVHVGDSVVHLSGPYACSLAGLHAVQRLHLRHPAADRQVQKSKHATTPSMRNRRAFFAVSFHFTRQDAHRVGVKQRFTRGTLARCRLQYSAY